MARASSGTMRGTRSRNHPAVDPLGEATGTKDRNTTRDRGTRPRRSSRGPYANAATERLDDDDVRATNAECGRGARAIPPTALTLVVDASVALPACLSEAGFALLPDADLVAPELIWSKARSTLHELVWRREVTPTDGEAALGALEHCSVRWVRNRRLGSRLGGSLASSAGPRPTTHGRRSFQSKEIARRQISTGAIERNQEAPGYVRTCLLLHRQTRARRQATRSLHQSGPTVPAPRSTAPF